MSHESQGKSNDWYTPRFVFDSLNCMFDLDVAAAMHPIHANVPARRYITEDSLSKVWEGFVWMNPPYGHQRDKIKWLDKFFDHGNGIALMPDRTSTIWWQDAAKRSDAILFVYQKIKFIRPDGSIGDQPGNGTCLFGAGGYSEIVLRQAEEAGLGVVLKK